MPATSLTWVDGEPATALPLPDRGLDFGDGLFETLLVASGQPLFLSLHLQRLSDGLSRLAFADCSALVSQCIDDAASQVGQAGWCWASLRVTVTRGSAPRGYAIPEACQPRVIVTATELDRDCRAMVGAASLCVADIRCSGQAYLAGLKHLNRLEQVMAATQARRQGVDEALMLNQDSQVVSVSSGNLFAVFGKTLRTPALRDCGIAGTRRRLVMERWAKPLRLEVEEGEMPLADVQAADELFYSNALLGLRPVSALAGQRWHKHDVCNALFAQYLKELP